MKVANFCELQGADSGAFACKTAFHVEHKGNAKYT